MGQKYGLERNELGIRSELWRYTRRQPMPAFYAKE